MLYQRRDPISNRSPYDMDRIENRSLDFETLVLLKVKLILDDIINRLERKGLLAQSCFIEKAGSSGGTYHP